jgi:hypothetical protein
MQEMVLEALRDPIHRRWWLLLRALDSLPLDAAIALANRAEAFVLHGADEQTAQINALAGPNKLRPAQTPASPEAKVTREVAADSEAKVTGNAVASEQEATPEVAAASEGKVTEEVMAAAVYAPHAESAAKAAIIARLVQGAKNVEVAAEFGLTQRQVQGFRMQMLRSRSIGPRASSDRSTTSPKMPVSVDAVVRYLRQQGDVVVAAENGQFLVNGRFKLPLHELVDRANRMLARGSKDLFEGMPSAG